MQPLPPELEARIAALETSTAPVDFDRSGWVWMILLGLVLPLVCLVLGWSLGPGGS